jgi:phosphatidylserine/phosphatidylglycerophosphate/cardiolipin synthase-like enzyme
MIRALEQAGAGGVLHAKAVVADDEDVFVTSANLTQAALDRNIEVGLLVRDRALASSSIRASTSVTWPFAARTQPQPKMLRRR